VIVIDAMNRQEAMTCSLLLMMNVVDVGCILYFVLSSVIMYHVQYSGIYSNGKSKS
jgi:hypothetical protein